MIGGLRFVGVVAVCLVMVGVVPLTAQQVEVEQGLTASTQSVYTPPTCVPGVPFVDITCTTGFDPWIEQFGLDGITSGCGGGNYCPGTPVTRNQMAVFIEHAMRGTSNWPPHTVLVFHHPAAEVTSNVNSGSELLAMVAAIPNTGPEAPSAGNPWLIKVGPGIYDLGSGSLTLPAYTALEGAGQDITVITATGYPDYWYGTLIMGDHTGLRAVTVANLGGTSAFATAVWLSTNSSAVQLDNVTIRASQVSNIYPASGVSSDSPVSLAMRNCTVEAHGGGSNGGVGVYESTDMTVLEHVSVTVYGSAASGQSQGFSGTGGTSMILDSRFAVSDGLSPVGILATYGVLHLQNSIVSVPNSGISVYLGGNASGFLQGDDIYSGAVAVQTDPTGTTEIVNCKIDAATWLNNAFGYTVHAGGSKLTGVTSNSGTVKCAGNFDGSYNFLASTCP